MPLSDVAALLSYGFGRGSCSRSLLPRLLVLPNAVNEGDYRDDQSAKSDPVGGLHR